MRRKKRYVRRQNKRRCLVCGLLLGLCILGMAGRQRAAVTASGQDVNQRESMQWLTEHEKNKAYPEELLKALRKNPEILDFVKAYPNTPQLASGGITFLERLKKNPLFLQWDRRWGYVPYGKSCIGVSGCGPTCMAMVIYSLTGNADATPDVLAQKAMENGYYVEGVGTAWSYMKEIGMEYGVMASQFSRLEQWEMEDRLDDGNLIVCAMGPGDFTDEGHFIVIRGYTGKGFIVNDPFSRVRSAKKWDYTVISSQAEQMWVYAV